MVKLIYACMYDKQPAYLFDQLSQVSHGARVTRATTTGVLNVPRANTKYGQYSFGFRAPLQWNIPKIELKSAINKLQLNSLLKTSW